MAKKGAAGAKALAALENENRTMRGALFFYVFSVPGNLGSLVSGS